MYATNIATNTTTNGNLVTNPSIHEHKIIIEWISNNKYQKEKSLNREIV
jgi:hypothetical protein